MVQALPLEEEESGLNLDALSAPQEGVSWGDYKDVLDIGGYGIVEAVGGAGQFVTGQGDAGLFGRIRRFGARGADENFRELSPEAQRNFSAGFLPNAERSDIWDDDVSAGSAVGLKLTSALPSLAASLIPGGLAARVALAAGAAAPSAAAIGTAVGGAAGGVQTGGSLYSDITAAIMEEPDEELQKDNEVYRGLRAMGMSEEDAKAQVVEGAAGFMPLYMAALTMFTSKVGVESLLAKGVTGQAARRGVFKATGVGALGEGAQEGVESATQEVLTQKGKADASSADPHIDWYKALEAAAEGLAIGGAMGGGVGAAFGRGRDARADVAPEVEAAIAGTQPTPDAPPVTPNEQADAILGGVATVSPDQVQAPAPGHTIEAAAGATAPAPTVDEVGTIAGNRSVSGMIERGVRAGIFEVPGAVPADVGLALQTDVGMDPDAIEELPPQPAPDPTTHALTAVDPTLDVRGQPLPAPTGPAAVQRELGVPYAEAARIADERNAALGVPPTPSVAPAAPPVAGPTIPAAEEAAPPVASASTWTPEERAAYEAEINARAGITPTGRVLEDTAAQEAAAAEAARAAKLARPGPRMTEQKKARAEAGLPVMTAQEARKYDREQQRAKVAEQTRTALEATPLDVAKLTEPKAIKAYINDLLAKVPDYKKLPTKFTDEADPHLKLLAMARGVRNSNNKDLLNDYIRTDFALRQGVDIVSEYRKAQAAKSAPTVNEEVGDVTPEGNAIQMVVEESEPEPTPEEDAAREKAEFDRKMAERRAESAAAQAASAPKREVKVATTGRKKTNAWELARQKREAMAAARAIIEREPRSKFAAPTEAKAAEVVAEQIAQDPPSQPEVMPLIRLPESTEIPNPPAVSEIVSASQGRRTREVAEKTQQYLFEAKEQIEWAELQGELKRYPTMRIPLRQALKLPEVQQFTGAIQVGFGRFLYMRMRQLVPDLPVTVVDFPTMVQIHNDLVRQGYAAGPVPDGFYFNGEIVMQGTLDPQRMTHVMLHEGSHAIFRRALMENTQGAKAHITSLMNTVRRHFQAQANGGPIKYPDHVAYAMTNEDEFLAEAHSNAEFQRFLRTVPAEGASKFMSSRFSAGDNPGLISVWDKLKQLLGKILGGPFARNGTVLEEVMKATQALDVEVDDTAAVRTMMGQSAIQPLIPRDKVAAAKAYAADTGGSLSAMRKGLALQTLDQIRQRYKGLFQTSKGDGLEIVQTALQKAARTGDEIAKPAMAIAEEFRRISKDAEEGAKVAELVIQLTTLGVNVGPGANNDHLKARKVRNRQALSAVPRLQAAFDALKPESQKWVTEAGTFYRNVENNYRQEVLRQILSAHPKNFAPSTYGAIINAVMDGKLTEEHRGMLDDDNLFKSLRDLEGFKRVKGYYFPLKRFGDYVVNTYDKVENIGSGQIREDMSDDYSKVIEWTAATDKEAQDGYNAFADSTDLNITSVGKVWRDMAGNEISAADAKSVPHTVSYRVRVYVQGTEFFGSQREAKRFIRERGGEFDRVTDVMDKADLYSGQGLNNQQLSTILKSVQRSDTDDTTKRLMESVLRDAAIRLMPGSRVQKHKLSRVGAKGASEDLGRVTISYAQTAGGYLGKVKHMPEIRDALQEMRGIVKDTEDKQRPLRGQILNELHARVDENTFNNDHPLKVVQRIMALSFMDKLASPAYSIVNAMQVMMVTMPVLSARHGTLKTNAEIWRAYSAIGVWKATAQGAANIGTAARQIKQLTIDTRDIVGSMRKNMGKEKDGDFLQKVLDYANERTPLMDAGMELASGITSGGNSLDMGIAKVDRVFRQASLAVEAINRATTLVAAARLGRVSGMDEAAAIRYAFDTMQNTQGDYTPVNTPRAFKNPWASPFLQFKRYAQMMSMLMYDMTKDAISPSTPRKERMRALRQIAGFVSVQIAMAGALGLPGMELIKVVMMAAAALGFGDGYEEFERYLQEVAKDSMGAEFGEMLTRGVMSRGLGMLFGGHGVDLSSRLSLADMWTGFEEPKGQTKDDYMSYFAQLFLGAPGSLAVDWLTAIADVSKGDYAKGFEKLIPVKVVADFAKAARAYGDPTASIPITLPEAALQTVGFRSGRMANRGEEIGKRIADRKSLERDQKELNNLWMKATTKGEELKAQVRIAEHNKKVEKLYGKTGSAAKLKVHTKGLNKAKDERERDRARIQG